MKQRAPRNGTCNEDEQLVAGDSADPGLRYEHIAIGNATALFLEAPSFVK
jgi:hypothetical protein